MTTDPPDRNNPDEADDGLLEALQWGPIFVDRIWSRASDLRNYLIDSARYHARIALRDFTSHENEMATAGIHAGIAVEHLAKSYLASVHPVLLADKGCGVDTLLHLIGKSDLARTSPYTINTIGAIEACKRVRHVLPDFRYNEHADMPLFTARNSAGHLGIVSDIRKAMRIMVRLIDPILAGLGYDRSQFWGARLSIVETLHDETLDEVRAIVTIKYEGAKLHLQAQLDGLDTTEQATFKAIMAKGDHSRSDHEEPYSCPVCKSQGWLICSREYDVVEHGLKPGDEYDIVFNEPLAYPFTFECNVCGLRLEGDELEVAGMPDAIELPESEIGKSLLGNMRGQSARTSHPSEPLPEARRLRSRTPEPSLWPSQAYRKGDRCRRPAPGERGPSRFD